MTKIKICGLYRKEDIEAVNEFKPDYCGFIINFPKSHRNVDKEKVKELTKALSADIERVGVIVNQPEEFAAMLLEENVVDIIQLHGSEDEAYIARLREMLLGKGLENKKIWKAVKVRNTEDIAYAFSLGADRVIMDNGYGTGEVFDWSLMKDEERPFILAGGLRPDNISEAIRLMNPWAIDISSGVETDKKKDRDKIAAAVKACRP